MRILKQNDRVSFKWLKRRIRLFRISIVVRRRYVHLYTPGNTQVNRGIDYTSIMQAHTWDIIFFILVDAHSKWIEAQIVPSTIAQP